MRKNNIFTNMFEVAGQLIGDACDITFNLAKNVIEDGAEFATNVAFKAGESGAHLIDCTGEAVSEIISMTGDAIGVNWDNDDRVDLFQINDDDDDTESGKVPEFITHILEHNNEELKDYATEVTKE